MSSATAPFGLGSAAVGPRRFTRTGTLVVVGLVVAAVAVATAFAVVGRPATAVRAASFGGSAVIDDALGGPVVVDLADAAPTLRLEGVGAEVGATDEADVQAVALTDGTLLLDDQTGTINFVDPDQLVVAPDGAGVALPGPPSADAATAYPDGAQAFVVRQGPTASTVSLVGRPTVAVAALLQGSAGSSSGDAGAAGTATPSVPVATTSVAPLLGGAGSAVAADGRLWALVQPSGAAVHVEVVAPPRRAGRALVATDEGHALRPGTAPTGGSGSSGGAGSGSGGSGTTSGGAPAGSSGAGGGGGGTGASGAGAVVAALGTASARGGHQAVALATARGITLLVRADGRRADARPDLHLGRVGTVSAIVPVTGTAGRVLFAYHGTAGWFLAGVDLAGGRPVGPLPLSGPATTDLTRARAVTGAGASGPGTGSPGAAATSALGTSQLVGPVDDGGTVYALSAPAPGARPVMVRIDPADGRVAVVRAGGDPTGAYPLVGPAEQPDWTGEQVLADGPRLVFNNPDSELAVVLFTGQGGRAATVDKGSAVDIDPAAPPSDQVVPPGTAPTVSSTPSGPAPATQLVDAALACRTTTQKPNVPQVAPPQPATHSVTLSWTYPLIDSADCEPSSYVVTVTALGGAPQPATGTVPVTGQTAVDVTGLLSDTSYSFVVTAIINDAATSAPAVVATTTAEGPNPAATVTTTANGTTGWAVSWQPCTGTCPSTEPVAAWQVAAAACSGSFVGQLPTIEVPGGQDDTIVPFTADPGLIGTSLSFSVQPVGADGLLGDPTSDGACTEGWAVPQADEITLDAAELADGPTDSATLTVTPAPGVADADVYGSEVTDFVFTVGDQTQGPTTDPVATFGGLQPGTNYPTSVTVYPDGESQASVVVDGPPVTPTEPWPTDLAMTASAQNDSFLSGTVTATITDAFGDVPPGTSVSLEASGSILCGNEETAVPPTPVTPVGASDGQVTIDLSAVSGELGGTCGLSLALTEVGSDVHGGPSPAVTATFSTGQPGSIAASWDPAPSFPYSGSTVVAVTASGDPGLVTGWTATVVAPSGCTATVRSSEADGTVDLDVSPCVAAAVAAMQAAGASSTTFDVTVSVSWSGPLGQEAEEVTPPPQTLSVSGAGAGAA